MKGIEKIVSRLEADAQAELDALAAQSRSECDAIRAEYGEKAKNAYDARAKAGKEACALRGERLASSADMEAKKALLAFKQQMVSEVFEQAAQRLVKLPREKYISFLAAQAAKAARGGEELVFNAKDAKEIGKDVVAAANKLLGGKAELKLSRQTRDIPGGLIVKQGDIEANCAVDMLVTLRRSDLASQVAEILFA